MHDNYMMSAKASARSAGASFRCSSADDCIGMILDVILMASIFVVLCRVLSLLTVSIIVVGLVLVIMGQSSASPLCENS